MSSLLHSLLDPAAAVVFPTDRSPSPAISITDHIRDVDQFIAMSTTGSIPSMVGSHQAMDKNTVIVGESGRPSARG